MVDVDEAMKYELALIVMLVLTAPLWRWWRRASVGADPGALMGTWATAIAGALLAVVALSVAVGHVFFPGEYCGTTPDAVNHKGLCRLVGVSLAALLLTVPALAVSLVTWWPWRRPFRLQAVRAAYVFSLLIGMLALSVIGGD